MTTTDTLPLHPARNALFNELHARPFPVLEQGARVSQLAILHQGATIADEVAHLALLCQHLGLAAPADSQACQHLDFGNMELRWERHNEFSTYTIIRPPDQHAPFSATALSLLPPNWLAALPGCVISGLHIESQAIPSLAPDAHAVRVHFEGHRLISS